MPYSDPSEVPSWVPEKFRPQWMHVWNSEYKKQKADGKSDKEAESIAFAAANSVIQKAGAKLGKSSADQGENRVTKLEPDGDHPVGHYLVVEDPDKPSAWRLRVKGVDGNPDHRLMGAVWATLHGGYRGNRHEGPQKAEAIAKLKALYKSEGLTVPEEASDPAFLERRICPVSELRVASDVGNSEISLAGYAAVFNQLSEWIGFSSIFRERIRPGAFTRTLKDNPDVRALINHDPSLVLGRTIAATLVLAEDERGLHADIRLPGTQVAQDLAVSIRRGDISQMSFGFRVPKAGDHWTSTLEGDIRELRDVDLEDVSVATFPAYQQTRVEIRSYIEFLESLPPETNPELQRQIEDLDLRLRLAKP